MLVYLSSYSVDRGDLGFRTTPALGGKGRVLRGGVFVWDIYPHSPSHSHSHSHPSPHSPVQTLAAIPKQKAQNSPYATHIPHREPVPSPAPPSHQHHPPSTQQPSPPPSVSSAFLFPRGAGARGLRRGRVGTIVRSSGSVFCWCVFESG